MDIQSQLHSIISQLQCQSYRYAKMRQLRDELIDNQCQSHLFFQELHPNYAPSNVVHVKQGNEWIVDPTTIIDICVHYLKEFICPQLLMTYEVSRARHEFMMWLDVLCMTSLVMIWMQTSLRMRWTRF